MDSASVTSASDDEFRDNSSFKRVKKNPLRKEEMKVFLRMRPIDASEPRGKQANWLVGWLIHVCMYAGPIGVDEEARCLKGISTDEYLNSRVDEFRGLHFNRIFGPKASQAEFFSEVIAPILPDILTHSKARS